MIAAIAVIFYACSPPTNINTGKKQHFNVKPVNLTINGIEKDTAMAGIFREAFAAYKVKLISADEMKVLNEKEVMRAGKKVFTPGAKFDSPEAMQRALGREHQYAANMLGISLVLEEKDDSLIIYKATWVNIPFPTDFSRPIVSKKREIDMTGLSYSLRSNVYAIVDSILFSGELK